MCDHIYKCGFTYISVSVIFTNVAIYRFLTQTAPYTNTTGARWSWPCGMHNLKLDWVSSEALVEMEWGERLPNTVPQWHSIQFRYVVDVLVEWYQISPEEVHFCLLGIDGWSYNAQSVQNTLILFIIRLTHANVWSQWGSLAAARSL